MFVIKNKIVEGKEVAINLISQVDKGAYSNIVLNDAFRRKRGKL